MLRLLGILLLAIGLALLGYDLLAALGGGGFAPEALGSWWAALHRDSLLLLQPAVERHLDPALWGSVAQPLLEAPAFLPFLLIAALLLTVSRLLGSRRRR